MKVRNSLPDQIIDKGITYKMNATLSAKNQAPTDGTRYRTILVLSKNLRHKRDFHGNQYPASQWIYTEVK